MGSKASKASSNTKDEKNKASKSVNEEEAFERVEISVKEKSEDMIRIILISDTHNLHGTLQMPEGDILIHAGDFTEDGTQKEIEDFDNWLAGLDTLTLLHFDTLTLWHFGTLTLGFQVLTTSTRSWCLETTTQERRRRP